MAWTDDEYERRLLDGREKWGAFISMTAAVGLLLFLSKTEHSDWMKLSPLAVGAFGTLYVVVVNSYYKRAEALSKAREKAAEDEGKELATVEAKGWTAYVGDIRFLGWLHSLAPFFVGAFVSVALFFGVDGKVAPTTQGGQSMIVPATSIDQDGLEVRSQK